MPTARSEGLVQASLCTWNEDVFFVDSDGHLFRLLNYIFKSALLVYPVKSCYSFCFFFCNLLLVLFVCFKTGSHCVAQTVLNPLSSCLKLSECWNYRRALPWLACL